MSTVTTIKRGGLTAAIDSMGAQLTSLALNGNEYLWQGDPAFWGKHAPILFPIVGSLRNNTATSAAGTCEMPRHGLARIVEHKLVEVSEDGSSVTYEITDTPESLKAFPFHFKLNMTYALTGDATLTQTFAVTNTGDVAGKDCILFDDMVDTAGSLCNAAKAIVEVGGARNVYACASHGVLSGPALERLEGSNITELALLNTIPETQGAGCSKIKYLSVAPMFGEAIERIYQEISIAKLFN